MMSVIRTVWTDDMNKLLIDLVNQQKSYHEMMDIMQLSQQVITLQMKKLGLKYQHISKYNNNLKKYIKIMIGVMNSLLQMG
jgi:hypothetical protein